MNPSIINNTPRRTLKKREAAGRRDAKYEKMYNKICPAAKLVAKRTTRISGRSIIDVNSTMGKRTIIQIGAPFGNIWAKKPLKSVIKAQIKMGVQKDNLSLITTE